MLAWYTAVALSFLPPTSLPTMVAFGERIAEAVSRAPIDLRNHYIAYASLKEVLDRPEQLRAGDTLAAQISAGGEETDPCVGFLRIVSFELERVANFVRRRPVTHIKTGTPPPPWEVGSKEGGSCHERR